MSSNKVYRKVSDYLIKAISSGEMKVGDAIYSENELCQILDVSRTSVRRAIREMVEYNILEARRGSGTYVRSLNQVTTICMVNHHKRVLRYNPLDTYYTDLIYAAERQAEAENSRFLVFSGIVRNDVELHGKMAHLNAEGIILDGNYQDYYENVNDFREYFKNVVILDGAPDETKLDTVSPELEKGLEEMLSWFDANKGEAIFLYNSSIARRRWACSCFKNAAERMSIAYRCYDYTKNIVGDIIEGIDHSYLIKMALDNMLPKVKCKVIFCCSDRTAMKTINTLKSIGYRVPGDIAVSGIGGIGFSEFTAPAITTLKINTTGLANEAVKLLCKKIHGEKQSKHVLVPSKIIKRESM